MCGKHQFYTCRLVRQNPRTDLIGIVTDKIPVNTRGALLQDRPIFYNLLLKFVARSAGGYTQLLGKPLAEMVNVVFNTFGFAAKTEEEAGFVQLMELEVDEETGDLLDQGSDLAC